MTFFRQKPIYKDEFQKTTKLGPKLIMVVLFKLLIIFTIFFLFFGPETRMTQDADTVSRGILHPQTQHNIKGQE